MDYFIFGLSIASFVFIVLALFFMIKEKKFENKKLKSGINMIIFGLFFLVLLIGINMLYYANEIFNFEEFLPLIYINYLTQIADFGFVPLVAVLFLIAMFIFKKLR